MQEQMIMEIAQRIRTLREIMEIPIAEMAQQTGLSADEYVAYEQDRGILHLHFFIIVRRRLALTSLN